MIPAPSLSEVIGCSLHLKLENLQYTSLSKARGAAIALSHLTDTQKRRRVITMSARDHAQAVAFHARQERVKATIVMPKQTPFSKVERTRSHSTNIILAGRRLDECEVKVIDYQAKHGSLLIHPYDDPHVISGQGKIGLEMINTVSHLNMLLVPIGHGGLMAGISIIAKDINPDIKIIGVQAELYPSMHQTMRGEKVICGG